MKWEDLGVSWRRWASAVGPIAFGRVTVLSLPPTRTGTVSLYAALKKR